MIPLEPRRREAHYTERTSGSDVDGPVSQRSGHEDKSALAVRRAAAFLAGGVLGLWAPVGAQMLASGVSSPWTAVVMVCAFALILPAALGLFLTRAGRQTGGFEARDGALLGLGLAAAGVAFRVFLKGMAWGGWLIAPVACGFWGLTVFLCLRQTAVDGSPPDPESESPTEGADVRIVASVCTAGNAAIGLMGAAVLYAMTVIVSSPSSAVAHFVMAAGVGLLLGRIAVLTAPAGKGGVFAAGLRLCCALCVLLLILKRLFWGYPDVALSIGAVSLSAVDHMGIEYAFPVYAEMIALVVLFCLWNSRLKTAPAGPVLAFPAAGVSMMAAGVGLGLSQVRAASGPSASFLLGTILTGAASGACAVMCLRTGTRRRVVEALLLLAVCASALAYSSGADWRSGCEPLRHVAASYLEKEFSSGSLTPGRIECSAFSDVAVVHAGKEELVFIRGDLAAAPTPLGLAPARMSAILLLALPPESGPLLLADVEASPVQEMLEAASGSRSVQVAYAERGGAGSLRGMGALRKELLSERGYAAIAFTPFFVTASAFPEELFKKEFLALCRNALAEDGVLITWLPTRCMSREHLRLAVASLAHVFPELHAWSAGDTMLLAGFRGPPPAYLRRVEAAYRVPEVAFLMARAGMAGTWDVVASYSLGPTGARQFVSGTPPLGLSDCLCGFMPRLSLAAETSPENLVLFGQFRLSEADNAWRVAAGDSARTPMEFRQAYVSRTRALFEMADRAARHRADEFRAFLQQDKAILVELVGDESPQRYARLEYLFQLGLDDLALEEAVEHLRINREDAYLHCRVGLLLGRRKDMQGALKHLEAACSIRPQYVEARLALGRLLVDEGVPERAVRALEEGLEAAPESVPLILQLAQTCLSLHKKQKAEALLKRAVELDPGNPDTHNLLKMLKD